MQEQEIARGEAEKRGAEGEARWRFGDEKLLPKEMRGREVIEEGLFQEVQGDWTPMEKQRQEVLEEMQR